RDEGRDQRIYEIARSEPCEERDTGQRRRRRPRLDPVKRRRQGCEGSGQAWRGYADEAACATGRDRAGVCLFRVKFGFELHHGRSAFHTWRRNDGGPGRSIAATVKISTEKILFV